MTPRKSDKEGEEGTYVFSRAEDRSQWLHISYLLDKYKPLVYLVIAALLALGFGFKTPAQTSNEIKAEVKVVRDSVTAVSTRLVQQQDLLVKTQQGLNTLVRLKCLDAITRASRDILRASNINCGD